MNTPAPTFTAPRFSAQSNVELLDVHQRSEWEEAYQAIAPLDPLRTDHAFSWQWREVITPVFGHRPLYLVLYDRGGAPLALCPLYHFRSPLFGSALISVPYLNSGGILAVNDEARRFMSSSIIALGQGLSCRYAELRHRAPTLLSSGVSSLAADYEERSHKVSMILPLPSSVDELIRSFPTKLRTKTKRAEKAGGVVISTSGDAATPDLVSDFFKVFSENMRDLGTPSYPRELFSKTLQAFGADCSLHVVRINNEPIAAGLTIHNGGKTEIPWGSSLRKYNHLSPNMFLYREILSDSVRRGDREFDFGRSTPDSGPYHFKAQWGATPLPLYWGYAPLKGSIPDVSPKNSKFSTLIELWKYLPVPVANVLGRYLTCGIP